MATRQRIGLRHVRALKPGEKVWDSSVIGFGVRRQQSEERSYFLWYRTKEGRRQRWLTIGKHGAPWTPESARVEARRLLGEVAHNGDPATDKQAKRNAKTIAELCDLYLADAKAGRLLTRNKQPKKASTLAIDVGRIERHIKPMLGRRAVTAVTREDVEALLHDIAAGKTAAKIKTKDRGLARVTGGEGAANRVVGLLGAIFTYAVRLRMRSDNPVRGVVLFADGERDRRLSDAEYKALGEALRKAEGQSIWPAAVAATHLLALTGWRTGEALQLCWSDIDLARRTALLLDTKTGKSARPLSRIACDLLRSLNRSGALVFPATRGGGNVMLSGYKKMFRKITKIGKLPADVTPHALRHSFTSLANDLGYTDLTIGALVGHKGRTITSRYVHSADAILLAAADAVADRTAELMGDRRHEAKIIGLRREALDGEPRSEASTWGDRLNSHRINGERP
jgi:integrase